MFLLTALGKELIGLPEDEGQRRTLLLDRVYRRGRSRRVTAKANSLQNDPEQLESEEGEEALFRSKVTGNEPERWQDVQLARPH